MKETRENPQEAILKEYIGKYFASHEGCAAINGNPAFKKAAIDTAVEISLLSDREVMAKASTFDKPSLIESEKILFVIRDEEQVKVNLLRQAYASRRIERSLSMLPYSKDRNKRQKEYDTAKQMCINAAVEFGCEKLSPGTERNPIAENYRRTLSK